MTNVIIAMLATVLGYTTSAVVAEVRHSGPAAALIVAVEMPPQLRPIVAAEAPAFVSTGAPEWNSRTVAVPQVAAVRAFGVVRTAGVAR